MGQWWVLMWRIAFSHLTLSPFRIFGQEQRPALQEPKRGETEFKRTIFFPRVDVQAKRTLRVCVCRSCVCQRTRSWRSALTGKSWVTRSVLIRWDTSVSICASLLQFLRFPEVCRVFPCLRPSILSHSKTNSGVFPLSSAEWAVWWGFSVATHSLRNSLTLVCPPCTLTHTGPVTGWRVKSPSTPHWAQCSVSAGLAVTLPPPAYVALLSSSSLSAGFSLLFSSSLFIFLSLCSICHPASSCLHLSIPC